MSHEMNEDRVREALDAAREVCATVRATGGLVQRLDGLYGLAADHDWIDMAEALTALAAALGEQLPIVRMEPLGGVDEPDPPLGERALDDETREEYGPEEDA